MAYCSQADLEIALGGAHVLRELADPDGTGTAVASIVTDYLESGAGPLRARLQKKYDAETINNLDADSLRLCRDINKWRSARIAWLEGGRGQAIPDHILRQGEWADLEADKIGNGEIFLGRVVGGTAATINLAVGVVDFDPYATGVSVSSFKLGFR